MGCKQDLLRHNTYIITKEQGIVNTDLASCRRFRYNQNMNLLRKVYFCLVYLLPAVLFFSYYPLLSLGSDTTMNFEFSLPLIWLLLFAPVALLNLFFAAKTSSKTQNLPTLLRRQLPGITDRKFFLFALFPLYATLSIFWSANPTRTILTAGVLWLTFLAVFAILWVTPLLQPQPNFRKTLLYMIIISTGIVCLFCWLQCILDLAELPRTTTLLCPGCTYRTFGFPHPSGFAIEPQFMGNLLLAPTLLVLFLLVYRSRAESFNLSTPLLIVSALLFSATLFVTMSRGAIYAYLVALFIFFLFALFQRQKWHLVIIIPLTTFLISLLAQGAFAALSPTSDTFFSGTAKVIHQMSLGLIDLRSTQSVEKPVENPQTTEQNISESTSEDSKNDQWSENSSKNAPETDQQSESTQNESMFDGYVAASTNVRLGLNEVALATWYTDPDREGASCTDVDPRTDVCLWSGPVSLPRMLFGVGLGGAGVAMSRAFPEHELALPNAIVQNEAVSLLLETGLIGILLVLLALFLAFRPRSDFWLSPALPLLLPLIVAYLITLNFFSGLPNALQIYLMPPLLFYLFQKPCQKKRSVIQ